MNWLSTMNTRSNFAASACRARSMYQRMSTLASPGISGFSQVSCSPGPPTPIRTAPSFNCRTMRSPFEGSPARAAADPRAAQRTARIGAFRREKSGARRSGRGPTRGGRGAAEIDGTAAGQQQRPDGNGGTSSATLLGARGCRAGCHVLIVSRRDGTVQVRVPITFDRGSRSMCAWLVA